MASTQRLASGKWRARYRDEAGREHAKHFVRKIDAQQWLDEVTAALVTGQYVDPRAGKITLRQYASGWEALQVGREGTAAITDNALRVHILPLLGDRTVASLRRSDIQGLVKTVSGRLAPSTVRNVYDVLNRVLAAAVDDRVISVSPAKRIALPALTHGEVVPPSSADVAAVAEQVNPRYRGLVVLLAGGGLRIGEALGLRISDVDFLRRQVRIERQRLQSGLIGPTKTRSSTRTIPLGQVVVDELAAYLAAYPSAEWLFTTDTGEALTYRRWKYIWVDAKSAAKVDAGMDTHALRHFAASAAISGGASVKQVQMFLGHSSAAITLRVYSHLWPGDDDRLRDVMDAALSPLADCVRTEAASI